MADLESRAAEIPIDRDSSTEPLNEQHTIPSHDASLDSQSLPSLSQESVPNPLANLFHGARPLVQPEGTDNDTDALTPLSSATAEVEPSYASEDLLVTNAVESGSNASVAGQSAPGRSIFSYFGNGTNSGTATPVDKPGKPAAAGQSKRKRKTGGEQTGQARLLAGGAAGWVLGRREDSAAASESDVASTAEAGSSTAAAPKRGKAKTASGALADEEAEMKEMKKKAGKARSAAKGRKRVAGSDQAAQEAPEGSQISVGDTATEPVAASQSSPEKRKRGRPR